jgi:hypothetical protein
VLVTVGCGGSSTDAADGGNGGAEFGPTASPTASPTEEAAAEEPAESSVDDLTIARGRFCDRVDTAAISAALGAKGLEVVRELKPGQKYLPGPGGTKVTSQAWSCSLATGAGSRLGVNVAVHGQDMNPEAYAEMLDAYASGREFLKKADGSPACVEEAAAEYGERGQRIVCGRPEQKSRTSYASGIAQVSYYGYVDGTLVSCHAWTSRHADLEALRPAAADFCAGMLEALST